MKYHILFIMYFLQDNPKIGVGAGLGSGAAMAVPHLFTDEMILKVVSGIGVWCGALVAVLSVISQLIKVYRQYKNKTPNNNLQ